MLPLALISIFASAETNRSSSRMRSEGMVAGLDSVAIRLRRGLIEDVVAVSTAPFQKAGEDSQPSNPSCRRLIELMRARHGGKVSFIKYGSNGRPICQFSWVAPLRPVRAVEQTSSITNGMLTLVRRNGGGEDFRIAYPASELERMAGANGLDRSVRLGVSTASGSVFFGNDLGTTNRWLGRTNLAIELTGFDASLTASVARLPPTAAQWISILLPILMLLGSAVVGWLLVYRLFSRQLGFLTRQLDAYKPGAVIESGSYTATGAVEVIALGRALQDLSEIVANKIADVSTGLARQTTLTREVHHRVKNNLQVIASLISLHSRAAETVAAKNAYVTIQRRVDALSVVQRSHHAETETPTGISLNALVRELAQSFEATLDNHGNANVSCNMTSAMVTQDTATSIAFLLTELLELSFTVNRYQPISIEGNVEHERWCLLRFCSNSYQRSDQLDHLLRDRYGRVLMGLSRQLRRELHHDKVAGSFTISIPALKEGGD